MTFLSSQFVPYLKFLEGLDVAAAAPVPKAVSESHDQALGYLGFLQIHCCFSYMCFPIFLSGRELCIFITVVIFQCFKVFACFPLFGHRSRDVVLRLKVFTVSKE